ncbi:MAG: glutathione-disulfide reductase [Pseudomonadota bacterium]
MEKFDYFVIGGGSGGVRFARMAAATGARVGIAEEYRYGGTCVIRGCVPKKLYVYASRFKENFALAESFGWSLGSADFNWATLRDNKEKEITRLEGIYYKLLAGSDVHIFNDRASVSGMNKIKLEGSGQEVEADKVIIATGGWPRPLEVNGQMIGMTSNEIFDLKELPEKLFIYGAGYIALEFASIFNGLGVDVTVGFRGDMILRGFDQQIRERLTEEFTRKNIKLIPKLQLDDLQFKDNKLMIQTPSGMQAAVQEFFSILNATGRVPNTDRLGLEEVGVILDKNKAIQVDKYSKTNLDWVYALGDVTNRMNLTPVAIEEAMCLVDTLCHNKPRPMAYENIATAVFTTPEIGTIGISEDIAQEKGFMVDIYESQFRPMKNTLSDKAFKMYMKLIVDTATDKVIGVHILGPDAGEMIQSVAIAVKAGLTKADFDATMAVHPTAGEEFVTLRQVARSLPKTELKNTG